MPVWHPLFQYHWHLSLRRLSGLIVFSYMNCLLLITASEDAVSQTDESLHYIRGEYPCSMHFYLHLTWELGLTIIGLSATLSTYIQKLKQIIICSSVPLCYTRVRANWRLLGFILSADSCAIPHELLVQVHVILPWSGDGLLVFNHLGVIIRMSLFMIVTTIRTTFNTSLDLLCDNHDRFRSLYHPLVPSPSTAFAGV